LSRTDTPQTVQGWDFIWPFFVKSALAAAAAVGAVDPSGSSGTVGGACLPVPIHDSDGGVRS